MKKLSFKLTALTVIFAHLFTICLNDVSFAQTTSSSTQTSQSAPARASSTSITTSSTSNTASSGSSSNTTTQKKSATSSAKALSAFSSSGSSSSGSGVGSFNTAALQSLQNDPFTGRATFSVPIAVPSGRKGIQPNIGLAYASGQGNGILGVGWSLELGHIERSTKKGAPTYDDSKDTFVFVSGNSSQELVKISATEYRPKIEGSFSKFIYNGTGAWQVIDKASNTYSFGSSDTSRQRKDASKIFSWYLDKVLDISGNYMTLSYQSDQNQIYPSLISYTGNQAKGDTPTYTVEVTLENRTDATINYRNGIKITTAKRISQVNVKYNNTLVRAYKLEYLPITNTRVFSSLSKVSLLGADGTTSYPPIAFTYQQSSPSFQNIQQWPIAWGSDSRRNSEAWNFLRYPEGYTLGSTMIDMNGDGLPDRVLRDTNNGFFVQLNNGNSFSQGTTWGPLLFSNPALESNIEGFDKNLGLLDINGDGFTDRVYYVVYDTKYQVQLNNGRGFGSTPIYWTGLGRSIGSQAFDCMTSISVSPYGIRADMLDINGDGLIDKVTPKRAGAPYNYMEVQLNANQTFSAIQQWPIDWGSDSRVNSGGWNFLRYSDEGYVFSGMLDMNGDGLPDRVLTDTTNGFIVQLNNGNGFDRGIVWGPLMPLNSGLEWTHEGLYKHLGLFDINGDGLPDRVYFVGAGERRYQVQLNNGHGFENAFVDWNNVGLGGEAYDCITGTSLSLSGTLADMLDINGDGLIDKVTSKRGDAPYDYLEVQLNGNTVPPNYITQVDNGLGATTQIEYAPSSRYDNKGSDGLPHLPFPVYTVKKITSSDGQDSSYSTSYEYKGGFYDTQDREFRGFAYVKAIDAEGSCTETYFKQDDIYKGRPYLQQTKDKNGALFSKTENIWQSTQPSTGVSFPYLAQTDSYIYDGDSIFKQTRAKFEYDSYGNPVKVISEGDVSITGDEKTQVTEYTSNTAVYLLGFPKHTYLLDNNQNKVSEKWFYYDAATSSDTSPARGFLTKEEVARVNPLTSQSVSLAASYAYDDYGNVLSATNALGKTAITTYDTTFHAYPLKVTNTLGQSASSTYDYATGNVLTTTDTNGQITTNIYDTLGRLIKAIGPLDTSQYPAVLYEYDLTSRPIKITKKVKSSYELSATSYELMYSFYDGLGRLIESKSPAAPDPVSGSVRQIVSGSVVYDSRGQVKEKYLPYYIEPGAGSLEQFVPPSYTTPHATFTYDAMGRLIQTTNADATYATVNYSDWVTTSTDENGHSKTQYRDAYGRVTKIEELNGSQVYTTTYQYDTLGNLNKLTDNQGNITQIWYDSLGRKLKMDDPDMGIWTYEYDSLGNLITQTDAKGQILKFQYDDLNRLIEKGSQLSMQYSVLTSYLYDDTSKSNCIGRLSKVTDQSGSTEFFYDTLGREIKSTKTVLGTQYTVQRTYDALDRLITLIYPDNSLIQYTYNSQGIASVSSQQPGAAVTQPIVSSITYSPTGQMLRIDYGNGTHTEYTYNPNTLRLSQLKTINTQQQSIQDLNYQFDNIGNIKELRDYVNTATQSFLYDDLNRLTQASGAYGAFSYQYDSIGNMLSKEGVSLSYGKLGKLPHAVTQYGSTAIDYDTNGNMLTKGNLKYSYDTENRLTKVEETANLAPLTASLILKPGWNFISLPILPSDKSASNVFLSIKGKYDQVSRYNATSKTFEHYVGNSKYDQFTTLEHNRGYQIYITSATPVTLSVSGLYPAACGLQLKTGYNLIGGNHKDQSIKDILKGIDFTKLKRYNEDAKTFEDYPSSFSNLETGEAYYLNSTKDQTWTVTNTAPTTTFTYDGDGGRVKKTVTSNTSQVSSTTYVGSLYEVADGIAKKYIYAGANRICSIESTHTYYTHSDHLGSSNVVTDETGGQVAFTEFTPYGSTFKQTGTYDPKRKFTGKELDDSTGLYYYGARYYDHELGRFTQADTIVQSPYNPQTLNRYSYCNNNPINYVDPTGHSWKSFWRAIGIVLSVATIAVGVMTGNPYLIASGALSLVNSATSSYQGGGWNTAHQVMGYTAAALAVAGAFYSPPGTASAELGYDAEGNYVGTVYLDTITVTKTQAAIQAEQMTQLGNAVSGTFAAVQTGVNAAGSWATSLIIDTSTINGGLELMRGANYGTARGWLEGSVGFIGVTAATADAGLGVASFGAKGAVVQGAKRIVIGEGSERVAAKALAIGAEHYVPRKTVQEIGIKNAMRNNYQWLKRKVEQGYEIIDEGLDRDPERTTRGIFYEAEKRWLKIWGK